MLEAKALTLVKGGKRLLNDINLRLRPGEFVAVLGPNGAGKSTLMHCLSGAERASGEVRMDTRCPTTLSAFELATQRAVLEQTPRVIAPFSVEALVQLGIPRELTGSEIAMITDQALRLLDLEALRRRPISNLSGGEQHRTHMARVMAQLWAGQRLGGGRYLLIDEPTASLDLQHQITVLKAAREAASQGVGVLAILHDISLAASVAQRIVLLKRGRVVADGCPQSILTGSRLGELYGLPIRVQEVEDGLTVTPHYSACWASA
ncbi:ATP-binding cassette domain-containing protein [Halomonas campisalis]|uniref:ATP-binding cassette domain-containing protein n=1 Tax=Billgrantia campisalis TaxID=74661 RepID=A0ABS9PAL9_9GAMM|nr:ATP-binding cassette domain-containing protein [Halomonas campisalis]MCG6658803.1 ATP-binding cassette domain-containing protein [Halomonas campisalis]MDR5864766.1 ATP-binding cassette domain-containing protein [Halomonas campisalis]